MDFTTVNNVAISGDVAEGEKHFGLIARGVFDQTHILVAMETEMGAPVALSNYGEIEIHLGDDTGDVPSISFLGDNTLVMGTIPAIQDVIVVHIDAESHLSGTVYDFFNNFGEPLVRVAVKIPPEVLDGLSEAGNNPDLGIPIAMEPSRS